MSVTDDTDDRVQGGNDSAGTVEPTAQAADASLAGSPDADDAVPGSPFSQNERVVRGLALALLVIPAGVIAWSILWSIGFIASIVSWGVAIGAVWLYRAGSKARVTRGAFWGVVVIVVVTVVLSLLAGIVIDLAAAIDIPLIDALTRPEFWQLFADNLFGNPDLWQAYLPQVALALLFAALGCFMTVRRLARESRA
ncbi:hypothetical protein [Leifsonia aquatica]|uniref:hypothetical protein n=1 Tax=Leifsonia aquatica TaxID=144185 RepID=UPI0004692BFC